MILELGLWAASSLVIHAGFRWRAERKRKNAPRFVSRHEIVWCTACAAAYPSIWRRDRNCGMGSIHSGSRFTLVPRAVEGCGCDRCAALEKVGVPRIQFEGEPKKEEAESERIRELEAALRIRRYSGIWG